MNKKFYILLLFFGFFLMSASGYACNQSKTEKPCCKKETFSNSEKKSCCNDKDNTKKECDGNCGNKNCTTSSFQLSFITFNENVIETKSNLSDCVFQENKFHYTKTFVSSGFTSIWLPPKI